MKKILVILIIAILLTAVVIAITQNPSDNSQNSQTIEVTTQQFKFTPNQINVSLNTKLTLRITSIDVSHGFQIDEFEVYNQVVPAGETIDVTFLVNKVGTFYFYCTVLCGTRHSDHLGVLNVS